MTDYIIFDIETVEREVPLSIAEAKRKSLRNRFVKEEVIQKNFDEWKAESWKFQPGGSRPIAIGVHSTRTNISEVETGESEDELAAFFCDKILQNEGAKLVGFNIKKFDLPQLLVSASKMGICTRLNLGRYDIIDLMKEPYGHDVGMYSLDYYATIFGLPTHEEDGSMVAGMWEQDKKDGGTRVKDYCLKDVQLTKALFDTYRLFHKF